MAIHLFYSQAKVLLGPRRLPVQVVRKQDDERGLEDESVDDDGVPRPGLRCFLVQASGRTSSRSSASTATFHGTVRVRGTEYSITNSMWHSTKPAARARDSTRIIEPLPTGQHSPEFEEAPPRARDVVVTSFMTCSVEGFSRPLFFPPSVCEKGRFGEDDPSATSGSGKGLEVLWWCGGDGVAALPLGLSARHSLTAARSRRLTLWLTLALLSP